MNRNYVYLHHYHCLDWHDMSTERTMLTNEEGGYGFTDPARAIAEDIYDRFRYIEGLSAENVCEMLMDNSEHKILTNKDSETKDDGTIVVYPSAITISKGKDEVITVNEEFDQYTSAYYYSVETIDDDALVYIVPEEIVNPCKGCDLLEYLSDDYVKTLEEAVAIRDKRNKELQEGSLKPVSDDDSFTIFPMDIAKLHVNKWYLIWKEILALAEKTDTDLRGLRGYYVGILLNILRTKYIESMPEKYRKCRMKTIYVELKQHGYVTDRVESLLNRYEPYSEEWFKKLYVLAHVEAGTKERFEKLPDFFCEFSVYADKLYTDLRTQYPKKNGYIIIDRNGNIKIVYDSYGLLSHKEEDGSHSPYFGYGDLDCGRIDALFDFRRAKFVDELPSDELAEEWRQKYEAYEDRKWEKSLAELVAKHGKEHVIVHSRGCYEILNDNGDVAKGSISIFDDFAAARS